MKKTTKIAIILLIVLGIFMGATNVRADDTNNVKKDDTNNVQNDGTNNEKKELTWTDGSKAKITVEEDRSDNARTTYANITGIERNKDHNYFVYVTKSNSKPTIKMDEKGQPDGYISTLTEGKNRIIVDKYLELNGDTYIYIYEVQYNEGKAVGKIITTGLKVNRIEHKIGTKITGYFHGIGSSSKDGTAILIWEPRDSEVKRNVKLKIGRVTDNNILRSIKNGESGCLNKLLAYAKSGQAVYQATVPEGDSDSITDKFNIIDEAYYFVYAQLDDENGKYYPVEDVSLYQGAVRDSIGKNLYDYLDDKFKWNLGDENQQTATKDDTTAKINKLPQTGQAITILGAIGIAIVLVVVFARKSKKYDI